MKAAQVQTPARASPAEIEIPPHVIDALDYARSLVDGAKDVAAMFRVGATAVFRKTTNRDLHWGRIMEILDLMGEEGGLFDPDQRQRIYTAALKDAEQPPPNGKIPGIVTPADLQIYFATWRNEIATAPDRDLKWAECIANVRGKMLAQEIGRIAAERHLVAIAKEFDIAGDIVAPLDGKPAAPAMNGHTAAPRPNSPADNGATVPVPTTGKSLVAFPMAAFGDIKLDRSATGYLVKGLLSSTGIAVVWGPPKCGKSFFVMDLALHVAKGWPYRGKRVRQATVIYFVLEGRSALPKRIEAMRRHYTIEDAPLYLITKQLDLIKQADAVIASIKAQIELNPCPTPGLIVLDTLNRSLRGSESKDEDMGAYLAAADRIAEAFQCLVIIVHHCGIDLSRPRGHTSLTGAVDTQIAVKRGPVRENMEFVASVEFVKDGQEGEEIWSVLERVEMGADDEGDEIASMVVAPIDSTGRKSMPAQRLSARQQLALDCLHECLAASNERAPTAYGIGNNITITTEDAWREECLSRGAIPRDGKNPRADFIRVREALQRRLIIGYKNNHVWKAT
jgi:hypothetical protein